MPDWYWIAYMVDGHDHLFRCCGPRAQEICERWAKVGYTPSLADLLSARLGTKVR